MAKKRGMGLGKDLGKRRADEIAMTVEGLKESDPRIRDYLETGGINLDPETQAWCAEFVNASLAQAGLPTSGSSAARSFLKYGEPVLSPRKGDIAVFKRRDDDPDPQRDIKGHAGFYMGEEYPGWLDILGGNQGDAANITMIDSDRLLGFSRPPGGAEPPETPSLAASLQSRVMPEGFDNNAMAQGLNDLGLPSMEVALPSMDAGPDLPKGLGGTVTPKLDWMYGNAVNTPRFQALEDAPNASLPSEYMRASLLQRRRR